MNYYSSNRYFPFDLARSICVVWIVGFWHMRQYLPLELRPSDMVLPVYKSVTMGVLACFTFLSGYFLKKYEFNNIKDVWVFYRKRLIRFYPLFVIAVIGLVVLGSTIRQGLLAIMGLSLFFSHPIHTLWYFSMLFLFYLMTPILKTRKGDWRKMSCSVSLIAIVLVTSYLFFDIRLFIFFPFYVLGLNISNHTVDKLLNPFSLAVSIVVFVVLCLWCQDNCFLQIVHSLCVVIAMLSFCKLVFLDKITQPVSYIAEASMCAYLFHRPIYLIIVIVMRNLTRYQFMTIPIALFSVVALFVFAYSIQSLYNRLINYILFKYGR